MRCALVALMAAGCARGVPPGTLPAGTQVTATLQTALASSVNRPGDTLRAIVSRDVKDAGDRVAIPAGSDVLLTVAELDAGTETRNPGGRIALAVSAITAGHAAIPVMATMEQLPYHVEWREAATGSASSRTRYRDLIVSPGTPIVLTLARALNVSTQ